jgi:type VI secretion system secreted protein Hcp
MPVTMRELGAAVEGGGADFFLHVQTKRAGKVKGESTSPGHADDIIVTGWAWGLQSGSALGDTQATARRSYSALTVHKQVDSATTALMSALVTNDEVKEAKLSLRRAGGEQEDYLVITLKAARITSLQHSGADDGSTRETLTIAFTEVEVQYRPQQSSGVRGGTFVFNDTLPSRA